MSSHTPYPKTATAQWRGLTLREMQMQRTLVQARIEIQKYKMSAYADGMRQRVDALGGTGIMSRILGAFSYAEYAMFAFRLVRKAIPLFRRKK